MLCYGGCASIRDFPTGGKSFFFLGIAGVSVSCTVYERVRVRVLRSVNHHRLAQLVAVGWARQYLRRSFSCMWHVDAT